MAWHNCKKRQWCLWRFMCPLSMHQFIDIICALENKINSKISMSSDTWKSVRQRVFQCTAAETIGRTKLPSSVWEENKLRGFPLETPTMPVVYRRSSRCFNEALHCAIAWYIYIASMHRQLNALTFELFCTTMSHMRDFGLNYRGWLRCTSLRNICRICKVFLKWQTPRSQASHHNRSRAVIDRYNVQRQLSYRTGSACA